MFQLAKLDISNEPLWFFKDQVEKTNGFCHPCIAM